MANMFATFWPPDNSLQATVYECSSGHLFNLHNPQLLERLLFPSHLRLSTLIYESVWLAAVQHGQAATVDFTGIVLIGTLSLCLAQLASLWHFRVTGQLPRGNAQTFTERGIGSVWNDFWRQLRTCGSYPLRPPRSSLQCQMHQSGSHYPGFRF